MKEENDTRKKDRSLPDDVRAVLITAAVSMLVSGLFAYLVYGGAGKAMAVAVFVALTVTPALYFLTLRDYGHLVAELGRTRELLSLLGARKHQDADLRASELVHHEAEYKSVLQSTRDVIIRIDNDGRIYNVNAAAKKLLNYEPFELEGASLERVIPGGVQRVVVDGFTSSLDEWSGEQSATPLEVEALAKDGRSFPAELTVSDCVISSRIYYVVIMRDITERKKAEEELREALSLLNSLVNNLNSGIVFETADLQLGFLNRGYMQLFGLAGEPEELVGGDALAQCNKIAEHFSDPDRFNIAAAKARYEMKQDTGQKIEMKDGRVLERDYLPVLAGEKFYGHLWHVRDITDQVRAAEELLASKEQAEEATMLKDKFVSLVSHDLKGPLATVMGYLELVLDDARDHMGQQQVNLLTRALSSGEHMSLLIDDLLNVGRLQTGKIQLRTEFFDGCELADRTIQHLSHMAERKGVAVENRLPSGHRLFGDKKLLGEVLQNIISNGIKFTGEGGRVTVLSPPGSPDTITVTDTGHGIPRDKQAALFRYDTNRSTTGTAGEKGTGFGLPLSLDIVKAHNGAIKVESEEGQGTSFHIVLPLVRPVIMVVNGGASNLGALLADAGPALMAEVVRAETCQQAEGVMNFNVPHLLIVDDEGDEEGCMALVRKVKENPLTDHLPVVLVTGRKDMESHEEAFRSGVDDLVVAPVDLNDLLSRLKKFLG